MIPGPYDPPAIYRGCTWATIGLVWRDQNGNPVDLTIYTPFAQTRGGINLFPKVIDAVNGVTTLGGHTPQQTANLPLGQQEWDWVWWENFPTGPKLPPILSGVIPILEPQTQDFESGT